MFALTETWQNDSDCTIMKSLFRLGLHLLEAARRQAAPGKAKLANDFGIAIVAMHGFALYSVPLMGRSV